MTRKDPRKTAQQHMISLISLPYGWETRFDPKSGRQYFFDYISKTTTWDAPQSANDLRFIPNLSHSSSEEVLQEYSLCPECNQPNTYEYWWLIDDNWKYKEFSNRDSDNLNNGLLVALKRLNDSSKINDQYLNELKYHLSAFKMTEFLFPLLGITQDPETSEYIIVMNYAHGGSLRSNLQKIFHKNLHSGNILVCNYFNENDDWNISLIKLLNIIYNCWENYNKDIEDIRDDKIKQAIIQFRNSDKELQEISIRPTVQHAEAYFTSRTFNLPELNRIITEFKENEESDYKLFGKTQIEQVDINQEI
ncbi:6318_t:CDS:2 [Dentiscutata heterogama]|uniref:6318_t:CDS:1 n=1 Tax=Dentiscutata heterogama TaxID=1316150 RepID=A0ACA9L4F6_9GLOM|nr:6318_t:CDS:2 [Dentiscutata heterogama]